MTPWKQGRSVTHAGGAHRSAGTSPAAKRGRYRGAKKLALLGTLIITAVAPLLVVRPAGAVSSTDWPTAYRGAIRELDPTDGTPVWETGLGAKVIGNPTLNGAGVLAVPTWDSSTNDPGVALVDASTGTELHYIDQGAVFAQPAFADGYLFVADEAPSLLAYAPT